MISNDMSSFKKTVGTTQRRLRRTITREQGRALEMIGHAADYLTDCYLYEGEEDQIIDFRSTMEAVQILSRMKLQIFETLPLSESFISRTWNQLLHRNTRR